MVKIETFICTYILYEMNIYIFIYLYAIYVLYSKLLGTLIRETSFKRGCLGHRHLLILADGISTIMLENTFEAIFTTVKPAYF